MQDQRLPIHIDYSTASASLLGLILAESPDDAVFKEIFQTNLHRPEILGLLMNNPDTPHEIRREISDRLNLSSQTLTEAEKASNTPDERSQTLLQKIQKLSVSERIQLALRAGKEVRTILLRDPNKEVSLTVLENPKLTETEVELIAKSRSVHDEALRKISKKKEWMKNYNILQSLITNPKTPPAISLPLVSDLKTRDLVLLCKNRNISEGVRSTAKKILKARQAH